MLAKVNAKDACILEIGCGDGFLTEFILRTSECKKLFCIEIDEAWAGFVKNKFKQDKRLTMFKADVLKFDFSVFEKEAPMVLLANLPYNISFPIFKLLVANKHLFSEGVFMVQEEVAQKITAQSGSDKGVSSLFMQYHFDLELVQKVYPESFSPAPNVMSRTVYFKPRQEPNHEIIAAANDEEFWNFTKKCFHHPRQTLLNNFKKAYLDESVIKKIDENLLDKRAQQLNMAHFTQIFNIISAIKSRG